MTEKTTMKLSILLALFLSFPLYASTGVKGVVATSPGCEGPVMVWVSLDKENYQERLLLMHTEVPVGGSFKFYLKPGDYQIRGSDKKGCETFKKVKLSNEVVDLALKVEPK